jgi:hypothetical protein
MRALVLPVSLIRAFILDRELALVTLRRTRYLQRTTYSVVCAFGALTSALFRIGLIVL